MGGGIIKIPGVNAIIAISAGGFIVAILIIIANEVLDIPARFFGAQPTPVNWTEISIETIFVFIIASFTIFVLRRFDTLHTQDQQALASAYAFQQSIIDGVADSIMVIGLDYRVRLANRAALEFSCGMTSKSRPLFCYEVYWQRDKPCNGSKYPCPLKKVREMGQPVAVVHEHLGVNKKLRFTEVIATPFLRNDGAFQGIIESARDITKRKQAEQTLEKYTKRLQALAAQLAEVEETERQQLARELHDRVGQNLTALGINLNMISTQIQNKAPSPMQGRLDDSLSLVEQTAEQVRDVTSNLRPPVLDDYGIVAALRWYSEQYTRRTNIEVMVKSQEPFPRLATFVEIAMFRVAQEALTNVAKHAHATLVEMRLEIENTTVRMIVIDDGIGFNLARLSEQGSGRGFGILNMKERTEAVGGKLHIESTPGCGSRIVMELTR